MRLEANDGTVISKLRMCAAGSSWCYRAAVCGSQRVDSPCRIRLGNREVAIEGIEKTINPIINLRAISGSVDLLVTTIAVIVESQYQSRMHVAAATVGFGENEDFSVDAESWARFRRWIEQLQVPTSS